MLTSTVANLFSVLLDFAADNLSVENDFPQSYNTVSTDSEWSAIFVLILTVSNIPGDTEFTRTSGPEIFARALIRCSCAAFVTEYACNDPVN